MATIVNPDGSTHESDPEDEYYARGGAFGTFHDRRPPKLSLNRETKELRCSSCGILGRVRGLEHAKSYAKYHREVEHQQPHGGWDGS
jgi:hypothetical protein